MCLYVFFQNIFRGQNPADAEYNYLDKAKRLEMYGVDLHNARVRGDNYIVIELSTAIQNKDVRFLFEQKYKYLKLIKGKIFKINVKDTKKKKIAELF